MNAGQFIGPYFCGCPTCADDILLVAESPDELQAQLDVVLTFSTQERYRIHPQKSKIIITGDTNPETTSNRWYLGDEPLEMNHRQLYPPGSGTCHFPAYSTLTDL